MTWTWPGHKSPLAQKTLRVIVRQREAAVRAPGMLQQHSSHAAITSAIRAMVAAWRKSIGHLPSAILRPHEVGEGSARDHAAICSCCSFHAACFVSGSFLSVLRVPQHCCMPSARALASGPCWVDLLGLGHHWGQVSPAYEQLTAPSTKVGFTGATKQVGELFCTSRTRPLPSRPVGFSAPEIDCTVQAFEVQSLPVLDSARV